MDREPKYICLNCLPRKEYFVGFGRLRAHLRAHHRQQWLNQDDSNRYRSDCGYMLEKKHYFPGDPDYEAWRAVGYGAPKVARPQQNEGPAEAARGINITPEQFTAMMSAIMGEVNKNVATGVNNTINSAASMLSLMSTSTKQETHARRCFPVPHTHNVLVAINNPAANPSPAMSMLESNSEYEAVAGPEKNYYTSEYVSGSAHIQAEDHTENSGEEEKEPEKLSANQPKTNTAESSGSGGEGNKEPEKLSASQPTTSTTEPSDCGDCKHGELCFTCGNLNDVDLMPAKKKEEKETDNVEPKELVKVRSPEVVTDNNKAMPLLGALPKEPLEPQSPAASGPGETLVSCPQPLIVNSNEDEVSVAEILAMLSEDQEANTATIALSSNDEKQAESQAEQVNAKQKTSANDKSNELAGIKSAHSDATTKGAIPKVGMPLINFVREEPVVLSANLPDVITIDSSQDETPPTPLLRRSTLLKVHSESIPPKKRKVPSATSTPKIPLKRQDTSKREFWPKDMKDDEHRLIFPDN